MSFLDLSLRLRFVWMLCLTGTLGPSETCECESYSCSQLKLMCFCLGSVCWPKQWCVDEFICMRACVVFLCGGFLEKSWSWVSMLWNVNCLHDNSPVSSFGFHLLGACRGSQTKCHACHGIIPLIDLSYLKNTYSSMQISVSSPVRH